MFARVRERTVQYAPQDWVSDQLVIDACKEVLDDVGPFGHSGKFVLQALVQVGHRNHRFGVRFAAEYPWRVVVGECLLVVPVDVPWP